MARAKQNGVFDFLTKQRETYSAATARKQREKERAKDRKDSLTVLKRADQQRKKAVKDEARRRDREDTSELRRLAIAEKREKAERRKADEVDRKIEREMREKGYRNPGKRNPIDAAAELAEAWHGRPAESETDYVEQVHFHGVLTDLGRLMEIKILVSARKAQAIKFDKDTRLCSSENGKQLYVVGGDQSLDLGALGIGGEEADKDLVLVGEAYSLTYVTAKQHLGRADKTPGPYEHVFGEDGGEAPMLVCDRLNDLVGFAGGSYKIDPTDYDGRYSAGIRN